MERRTEHTTVSRVTDTWDLLVVVSLVGELVGEATVGKGRLRHEVVLQRAHESWHCLDMLQSGVSASSIESSEVCHPRG